MTFNSGVHAARNHAPRCIANLRKTLLEELSSEHFSRSGDGMWELEDSGLSFTFSESESVIFSLGFWEPGDIGSSLTYSLKGSPGLIANESNVNLKTAPIYLEWKIQNSEVSPRTLIFDPSAHGYEAEATKLDYDRPSDIKSRGFGEPHPTVCKGCSRVGKFRFMAAFRYADELDEMRGRLPLEDLFEAMILIGVCDDCNVTNMIFDSAM